MKKFSELGEGQSFETTFLGRTLYYLPGLGFEYEPDRRHVLTAARNLGLEGAKTSYSCFFGMNELGAMVLAFPRTG